jgi:hypothetical protein
MLMGVALLGLTLWTAGATSIGPVWQEGELVSRKTVPVGHDIFRNRFIYRVQGGSVRYVVASDEPLNLDLHVPMRFAVGRRHLVIRDLEGHEHKTDLLRTLKKAPHGR